MNSSFAPVPLNERTLEASLLLTPLMKRGLIAFIMAGDPDLETSLKVALALIDEGVVALEIGVPFSDPVADGPVIQASAVRALQNGTTLRASFELVFEIKRLRPAIPVVLFTYLNPILRLGIDEFCRVARAHAVDATLVVDLPPEEARDHLRAHREHGLGTIFLASPTSRDDRLGQIIAISTGFIYGISRAGTTGAHQALADSLAAQIKKLATLRDAATANSQNRLPIAVGFGISTPAQAAAVSQLADQVIIGSRIVSLIHESASSADAEARVRAFARECIDAIKTASPCCV